MQNSTNGKTLDNYYPDVMKEAAKLRKNNFKSDVFEKNISDRNSAFNVINSYVRVDPPSKNLNLRSFIELNGIVVCDDLCEILKYVPKTNNYAPIFFSSQSLKKDTRNDEIYVSKYFINPIDINNLWAIFTLIDKQVKEKKDYFSITGKDFSNIIYISDIKKRFPDFILSVIFKNGGNAGSYDLKKHQEIPEGCRVFSNITDNIN